MRCRCEIHGKSHFPASSRLRFPKTPFCGALVFRGPFGRVNDKDVEGGGSGFEFEAKLFLESGEDGWAGGFRGVGWSVIGSPAEFEVVADGDTGFVDDGAATGEAEVIFQILRHAALDLEVAATAAAKEATWSGVALVDVFGFRLLGFEATFGDDEVVHEELFGFSVDFEVEAVGKEGSKHVGALVEGEVLCVGNFGGVEFGFEVELVAIDPGRAAGDEFGVVDPVGLADQFEERDVHAGVAVGGGPEVPSAVGMRAGLDGGDLKGNHFCRGGWCGSGGLLGEGGGSDENGNEEQQGGADRHQVTLLGMKVGRGNLELVSGRICEVPAKSDFRKFVSKLPKHRSSGIVVCPSYKRRFATSENLRCIFELYLCVLLQLLLRRIVGKGCPRDPIAVIFRQREQGIHMQRLFLCLIRKGIDVGLAG